MIRLLGKIPKTVAIAVSGGSDSMAALDFCIKGGRTVLAVYFNHGTEHGAEAEEFVRAYCKDKGIELQVGAADRKREPKESPEEYWRNMRYDFFAHIGFAPGNPSARLSDRRFPIITAHTIDDQVEQLIFSSLHGNPKLIPYRRVESFWFGEMKIIRPFLLTKKEVMVSWCDRNGVPYLVDPSNFNPKYRRSFIRNEIVPKAFIVNPGLYKVVAKKVRKEYDKLRVGRYRAGRV